MSTSATYDPAKQVSPSRAHYVGESDSLGMLRYQVLNILPGQILYLGLGGGFSTSHAAHAAINRPPQSDEST